MLNRGYRYLLLNIVDIIHVSLFSVYKWVYRTLCFTGSSDYLLLLPKFVVKPVFPSHRFLELLFLLLDGSLQLIERILYHL